MSRKHKQEYDNRLDQTLTESVCSEVTRKQLNYRIEINEDIFSLASGLSMSIMIIMVMEVSHSVQEYLPTFCLFAQTESTLSGN